MKVQVCCSVLHSVTYGFIDINCVVVVMKQYRDIKENSSVFALVQMCW